jgi:predicted XRE-type DNA-binding protein
MDVGYAMEMFVAHVSMKASIKSGQTLASYCSAVVNGLKRRGIVHDPKTEVYTYNVKTAISSFRKECEALQPERRLKVRIAYGYNLFKKVISAIRKVYADQPARAAQSSAYAGLHFGSSARISELMNKKMSEAKKSRLISMNRRLDIERDKGLRSANVGFAYPAKGPVLAHNRPPRGANAVAFFGFSKRNQAGITGVRGFPANDAEPEFCPVRMLQEQVAKYPPHHDGFLLNTWPNRATLESDLKWAMKRVAVDNGLDPKRFTPHSTRIGAIMAMQAHGVDERTQALQLGHANFTSKDAYDHSGLTEIRKLASVKYDDKVGPIDEIRFVYMKGMPNLTEYNDDAVDSEEDD